MGLGYRSAHFFSVYTLAVIFLLCTSGSPVLGVDDCQLVLLSGGNGKLSLPLNFTILTNSTCYEFQMSGVEKPVFFNFYAEMDTLVVKNISVYNVNTTGGLGVASERSFTGPEADSTNYIAVGFGRTTTVTDEEVVRVVIHLNSPLTADLIAATYTVDRCGLTYTTPPSEIQNPDYELGAAGENTFSCQISVAHIDSSSRATSIVFTQFQFTKPSALLINSSSTMQSADKYSGTDLPPDIILQDILVMKMNINPANRDTFHLFGADSSKECTMRVKVSSTGAVVTSPTLPSGQYPNRVHCKILLHAEKDKRLNLVITKLELAKDADLITVIDGGASRHLGDRLMTLLSALDGYRHKDVVMVSSGPVVLITFVTDEADTAAGFSFTVSEIDQGGRYYTPADIHFAPGEAQSSAANLVMQTTSMDQHTVALVPSEGQVLMSKAASVKCYDGDTTSSSLVASYRHDLPMFPAFTSHHMMLCVAEGFGPADDFKATIRAVSSSLGKFSSSAADSLSFSIDIGEAGEATTTYNWIVQPEMTDKTDLVIEMVIDKVSIPDTKANITITLQDMIGRVYSTITADTPLPLMVSAAVEKGLRLSVDVTPATPVTTTVTPATTVTPVTTVTTTVTPATTVTPVTTVTPASALRSQSKDVSPLIISADYTLGSIETVVTEATGVLMTPHYPKGTPQNTQKNWIFTVAATKSLQLSFSEMFELTEGSMLTVGSGDEPPTVYSNTTGPTRVAPSNLIINNTSVNESMAIIILLFTTSQSPVTGVEVTYSILDTGYKSILGQLPQEISTPANVTSSDYAATWILYVNKMNSDGMLQRVIGVVKFNSTATTTLELRDGCCADSPLIATEALPRDVIGFHFRTTSNSLYVSYRYVATENAEASQFSMSALTDVCKVYSQCKLQSNETVCFPPSWRCDGLYHCIDGIDEHNCNTPSPPSPTSAPAAESKKRPQAWVVVVCILSGIVIGGILTFIIVTVIMKRRGQGYNRLSGLMTPVPT